MNSSQYVLKYSTVCESISQYAINAEGVTAGLGKIKKPEATEYLQTIYLFIYLVVKVTGGWEGSPEKDSIYSSLLL